MTDVRSLLENELENVTGEITSTELLGRVTSNLPGDMEFEEAKEIAEEVLGDGATATDGGAAVDDTSETRVPDRPTPADGEAHFSGNVEYTAELRSRDWWVNWVLAVPRNGGEPDFDAKPTKQPVAPYDNGHARPTRWHDGLKDEDHPSTSFVEVVDWDGMTFGTDIEDVERVVSPELGIGVIIPVGGGEGESITLLDWDDVRDPETGDIHPVCAEAIDRLDGFAEISQSGEGIHQFVFGDIPGGMSKFLRHIDDEPFVGDDLPMIEMYSSGRLTAMTGKHVAGCGRDVVDGQELIDDLCWEFGEWSNNSTENPTDPFSRKRDGDIEYNNTPSHEEIGEAFQESIEYDGDDPEDWDVDDEVGVEYAAVLRSRDRKREGGFAHMSNWKLIRYAGLMGAEKGLPQEVVVDDLQEHPAWPDGDDRDRCVRQIRSAYRAYESDRLSPPSAETLARRGILPEDYAAPDYPVYDVVKSAAMEMHIIPINGKEVRVAIEQNGTRAFSEVQERGCWDSGTKRGRIAGRIVDVVTGAKPDSIRNGVKSALNQASIDAKNDKDEWEASMRSPREKDLRQRTVKVVCYPAADQAEWVVTMHPSEESSVDGPQEITFDQGDFNDANAGTFRNKHLATFYKKVEIDAEEWFDLVEYWLNIQETKERDPDHEEDAAIDKFIDWVQTMQVWADEEGFSWSSRNGYYWPEYDGGDDAICVPGQKVVEWKKREDFNDVNLSKALREREILPTAPQKRTINGEQRRFWPITADETNHSLETSHRVVDEDEEDEKPEGLR